MASTPQTPQIINPGSEPQLKDVFELYKRDTMLSTNCHAVATVVSFNPADANLTPPRPTITAQLNYPRTVIYPGVDGAAVPTPVTIPYSQLISVPVVILSGGGQNSSSGGGSSLTFPIVAGDQVLILFNDRSIDNWKSGSTSTDGAGNIIPNNTSLSSSRLHHLSDAMALVGFPIFPASNATYPTYSSSYALLSNGIAQVGVGNGKVLITNDPAQANNLGAILEAQVQALNVAMTALQTFMTATASATTAPQIATAAGTFAMAGTTAATAMTTAKTALTALLE